jgi:hypothetical protein
MPKRNTVGVEKMSKDTKTLDQLIADLENLRDGFGGETPVFLSGSFTQGLQDFQFLPRAVSKSSPRKIVQRGGVPCIVIVEE